MFFLHVNFSILNNFSEFLLLISLKWHNPLQILNKNEKAAFKIIEMFLFSSIGFSNFLKCFLFSTMIKFGKLKIKIKISLCEL